MNFLSKLLGGGSGKGGRRYQSDAKYAKNRIFQLRGTTDLLKVLKQHGIIDQVERELEYFFYTNSEDKARSLSAQLSKRGYEPVCHLFPGRKKVYCVSGDTTPLRMDDTILKQWVAEMCDIGANEDCLFDGWSTSP